MSTHATDDAAIPEVDRTRWRIDPTRSSVEFHAPNFWGLATVKGKFERYDGTLELYETPAIELTIEAASLNTNDKKRDTHLRSGDFFDVDNHPQVRFVSDSATLSGQQMKVRGHQRGSASPAPARSMSTSWRPCCTARPARSSTPSARQSRRSKPTSDNVTSSH